ncbi:TonB-dependent receptor [bacterium]|nr:TonB-dependent receptor [bacterium]MBU1985123.1 TonB-dependent receptor [bacterium]
MQPSRTARQTGFLPFILHPSSFILFFFLLAASASAAGLTGTVKDYSSGRAVEGATVSISALDLSTSTDARGRFELAGLPEGRYVVNLAKSGYHGYTYEQVVTDNRKRYRVTIELKPTEEGEHTAAYHEAQPRYRMPEVVVTTTRASSEYPVTFNNVSRSEIVENHYGQDTPLLLSELPNVSVYSEGGGGMGYSYLRMRGFGQDRIAVQINGVPLNDAETHEVFWVDLPDFAEDLADMQVQRGVGSSLYGPAAFGGTINLVTRTPGVGDQPGIRAEGMYGTWNTRRAMVQFQSGRVAGRYGVTGRITRMETDGYRYGSWARLWSYYLAGARFTDAHTTKLIFYGGPEKVHLAYEGISKDHLEGKITGDKEHDRRYNEFTYPGEIDNFFQPHYELHDEWRIRDNVQLDNTLYLFRGDGFYDQWRSGTDPNEYYYSGVDTSITEMDLLRRRDVAETDGGWIPRLSLDHRYGNTVIGGEMRIHDARHYGTVLWSTYVPQGSSPDYTYYDYGIAKRSFSGYVHNLFDLTSRLRALLDVQAVTHTLEMQDDKQWGVRWEKSYSSLNPRVGLNYLLIEGDTRVGRPAGTVYANLSFAQREPRPRDVYDPQDYWSLPLNVAHRFAGTEGDYEYTGPSLSPERLMNVELGTHWQWTRARAGVNVYHMALTDAIVPYGELDNLGVPKSINAKKTVHEGIELIGAWSPVDLITVSGNLALTDHRFVDHSEYDWALEEMVKRDDNRVGFDPIYVANARMEFSRWGGKAALGIRSVGKQYVDNTENDDTAVPAYTIFSFDLGYRFEKVPSARALELNLRVNNLFDLEHETFGWNYGEPLYFVGAPRAVYVTTAIEL